MRWALLNLLPAEGSKNCRDKGFAGGSMHAFCAAGRKKNFCGVFVETQTFGKSRWSGKKQSDSYCFPQSAMHFTHTQTHYMQATFSNGPTFISKHKNLASNAELRIGIIIEKQHRASGLTPKHKSHLCGGNFWSPLKLGSPFKHLH